ncbi:FlhC family transcriptional regulator [Marinobacterium aestuariivivens]|uniref:FlhC family transcriptional regulator n=1 Tax=Marinobacterium aestuariivivens TaxID=1698799 RepID=A0ABW2A970_9GAMM
MSKLAESSKLKRWVTAREMALMGYVTRIIILETGLTDKQIRRLYRELEEEGLKAAINRTTRTLRSGATLLGNQLAKLHASALMQFYREVGGDAIMTTTCVTYLNRAYRMYHALLCEMEQVDPNIRNVTFTISDAWCLASELRSGDAMFETCRSCHCDFFTSIHQSTGIDCPFCYEPHNKIKTDSTGKPTVSEAKEGLCGSVPVEGRDDASIIAMEAEFEFG